MTGGSRKDHTDAVCSDGVIIADSFSYAWDNEGGVLDMKTQLEQSQNKNSFTVWNKARKIQNNLVNKLLKSDLHMFSVKIPGMSLILCFIS